MKKNHIYLKSPGTLQARLVTFPGSANLTTSPQPTYRL
jgi:hypothetical protein